MYSLNDSCAQVVWTLKDSCLTSYQKFKVIPDACTYWVKPWGLTNVYIVHRLHPCWLASSLLLHCLCWCIAVWWHRTTINCQSTVEHETGGRSMWITCLLAHDTHKTDFPTINTRHRAACWITQISWWRCLTCNLNRPRHFNMSR